MIHTTLIPDSGTISIVVPENYIGKVMEIIAFTKDEGLYKTDTPANRKKLPSFTVLHTAVENFKFNRDEANER